jgi:hypothetical protein
MKMLESIVTIIPRTIMEPDIDARSASSASGIIIPPVAKSSGLVVANSAVARIMIPKIIRAVPANISA